MNKDGDCLNVVSENNVLYISYTEMNYVYRFLTTNDYWTITKSKPTKSVGFRRLPKTKQCVEHTASVCLNTDLLWAHEFLKMFQLRTVINGFIIVVEMRTRGANLQSTYWAMSNKRSSQNLSSIPGRGKLFFSLWHPDRLGGTPSFQFNRYRGLFPQMLSVRRLKLITHLYVVSRLRMTEVYFQNPHDFVAHFMKHRDKFNFALSVINIYNLNVISLISLMI
jgi:hypothetical protein